MPVEDNIHTKSPFMKRIRYFIFVFLFLLTGSLSQAGLLADPLALDEHERIGHIHGGEEDSGHHQPSSFGVTHTHQQKYNSDGPVSTNTHTHEISGSNSINYLSVNPSFSFIQPGPNFSAVHIDSKDQNSRPGLDSIFRPPILSLS